MDYAAALGVSLDNPEPIAPQDLRAGDEVVVGQNTNPVYVVIAVHGDRAWTFQRDQPWNDGLVHIRRLRRSAQVIQMEQRA